MSDSPTTSPAKSPPNSPKEDPKMDLDELHDSGSDDYFPVRITTTPPPSMKIKADPDGKAETLKPNFIEDRRGKRPDTPISISSDDEEEMKEKGKGKGSGFEDSSSESEGGGADGDKEGDSSELQFPSSNEEDEGVGRAGGGEASTSNPTSRRQVARKPTSSPSSSPEPPRPATQKPQSKSRPDLSSRLASTQLTTSANASKPTSRTTSVRTPIASSSRGRPFPAPLSAPPVVKNKKRRLSDAPEQPTPPVLTKEPPFKKLKFPSASQKPRATPKHISSCSHPPPATQPAPLSNSPSCARVEDMLKESDEEEPKKKSKRRRTSSVQEPPPSISAPVSTQHKKRIHGSKHPEYWLLDGSVVLRVENVLFRLHRSTLSQLSSYFKELFEDADTAVEDVEDSDSGQERMEGRPVFTLHDVTVRDFERLWKATTTAIGFVYKRPSFSELASILRASRALSFTLLDEYATTTLRQMWPSDLANLSSDRSPYASESIVLARKCNMPEILKRAFYELLRSSGLGQKEEDDPESLDEETEEISKEDMKMLIRARERLVLQWLMTASSPPKWSCPLEEQQPDQLAVERNNDAFAKCKESRQNFAAIWQKQVFEGGIFEEYLYDALCGLQKLIDIDWQHLGFCEGCVRSWKDGWGKDRTRIWELLDLWLELGSKEETESKES
ncbi:hypothetical protein C8Q75DRAFT_730140 [Abortiporus biennis]|nr:hypothetical protein C8Q75DRAFT_730140 [Abortiporus biennis]